VGQSGSGLPRSARGGVAAKKKSVTAAESNNRKRAWLWRKVKKIAHEWLKFIDASGVTTLCTRLFGRAAPGARVVEAGPNNYGQSTAVVSLIGIGGVETTMVSAGAVDTLVVEAFGEHFLRPCLQAGAIGGLDTLGAHRARGSEETARACTATVIWLPPYSPDFSPIEPRWAKLKTD
jgi:hypothetical protein